MNSSKNKIFAILISASTVSLAICFAIMAWTEPSTSPPAGNIAAPVNTSAYPQTKAGDLTIGGGLTITSDGTSFALKANNETDNGFFVVGQDGHTGINTEPASGMSLDVGGKAQADEFCFGDECCYSWPQCIEKYGTGGPPGISVVDPTRRTWEAIAMSASGQYQTAVTYNRGKIFTSSNFGKIWIAIELGDRVRGNTFNVAMTADGKYQIVTSGYLVPDERRHPDDFAYVSNNYGLPGSWSPDPLLDDVIDIALSGNGEFQLMAKYRDKAYYKIGSGSWTAVPNSDQCAFIPVGRPFCSVSVSADGNYAVVVMPPGGETPSGKITYSGGVWSGKQALPQNDHKVWQIKVSKDATHQIAGVWEGRTFTGPYVYVSDTSGNSWTKKTVKSINTSHDVTYSTAVAISAGTGSDDNGEYMIAAGGHADTDIPPEWGFAVSDNEGTDWRQSGQMDDYNVFKGAAISANGAYMTVIGGYLTQACYDCNGMGYLYRSNDKGVSWLPM